MRAEFITITITIGRQRPHPHETCCGETPPCDKRRLRTRAMLDPRLRVLPTTGVCAPTVLGGDCRSGDSGAWAVADLTSCVHHCEHCERCNYISFSKREKDCSWFQACEEANLIASYPGVPPGLLTSFQTFGFSTATFIDPAPGTLVVPNKGSGGGKGGGGKGAGKGGHKDRQVSFIRPDFSPIARYCGGHGAVMGGIAAHMSQVHHYANTTWQFTRHHHPRASRLHVCEVGLHCGHSALTFLEQDPRLHYTSFSLNATSRDEHTRRYLQSRYGERVTFVLGDSALALPEYLSSTPNLRCDIISVDGRHRYTAALQDAMHLIGVARCGALIFMDDVCDPKACHAHTANGKNQP